jgi:hypothetical protein
MNNTELRSLFPVRIGRGALLRPDGLAVGLVIGGAPAWDLLSLDERERLGADYHRLLLALDAPVDVYVVDLPPDLSCELARLRATSNQAMHPLLAQVRDEMADYLSELARGATSRAKDVVWGIAPQSGGGQNRSQSSERGPGLRDLLRPAHRSSRANFTSRSDTQLAEATERARRLADALSLLGGTPAPRLMEAEEIAGVLYQLADPVRSSRYPLSGALLDRVQRVVVAGETQR